MTAPNLTITVEPAEASASVYGALAAKTTNDPPNGQLSLILTITNNELSPVRLKQVTVSFVGPPSVASSLITADLTIASTKTERWIFAATNNIILPVPAPGVIKLGLVCDTFSDPARLEMTLAPYTSPANAGGYSFPAKSDDLKQGEYWIGRSAAHEAAGGGTQLFAYDLDVRAFDTSTKEWRTSSSGTSAAKNESYHIWGKPIYAMADGVVRQFNDGMVANTPPGFPSATPNPVEGNHFYILHGDDQTLYAHLQAGTMNSALKSGPNSDATGATVSKGQLLGLAGNSGRSSEPHLHVQVNRPTTPWPPRPLPFRDIFVLDLSVVPHIWPPENDAPWNAVSAQDLPNVTSAIWPGTLRPSKKIVGNWVNMSKPLTANIRVTMGTDTVMDTSASYERPHVFVEGDDFNLWCRYSDGAGAWSWFPMSKPPGVNIIGLVGAVSKMDTATSPPRPHKQPHVFVAGSDGNLWCLWTDGTGWPWTNLGKPPTANIRGLMGAANARVTPTSPELPHVFVEGNDFNLWCCWWDEARWRWVDMGKPQGVNIIGLVGAISVMDHLTSYKQPHVFVAGNDGNLWCRRSVSGQWQWDNLGKPPTANIRGLMGAANARVTPTSPELPHVFVEGNDFNLWCCWWSG